ncbi:MAG: hypothetical protein ABFS19_02060 [Thermodesulfobacteriota bacterium]
MNSFFNMIKKHPYLSGGGLFVFLVMTVRVQGDIATLVERTLVNLTSAIFLIWIILYGVLYMTGSLSPGDKPRIDFKRIGGSLIKGQSDEDEH